MMLSFIYERKYHILIFLVILFLLVVNNNYRNLKQLKEANEVLAYNLFSEYLFTYDKMLSGLSNIIEPNETAKNNEYWFHAQCNRFFTYGSIIEENHYYHRRINYQPILEIQLYKISYQAMDLSLYISSGEINIDDTTVSELKMIKANLSNLYKELSAYKVDLPFTGYTDQEEKNAAKSTLKNLKKDQDKLNKKINDILGQNEVLINKILSNQS